MKTALIGANIYTENGITENGCIVFDKGKITSFTASDDANIISLPANYHVIPGFIDLQLHGANGVDTMDASHDALTRICQTLPKEGTTSFLATTMTQTNANIERVMHAVDDFCQTDYPGAECLGIHLEGPFISPKHVGAQHPDTVKVPDIQLFKHWQQLSSDRIKLVTLATEQPNGLALTRYLSEHNILTSFGHSEADYQQALAAIDAGCTTATHLFNAMRGIHHRQPNAITALLLSTQIIPQLIVDGVHLHPAIVELVFRLKSKHNMVLVTDAMSAKGCDDGEYMLGGQKVYVNNGEARLADGTLAGSTLTMLDAVLNLQRFAHTDFATALYCATQVPAKMLGLTQHKGSLAIGKDADIVVLNDKFEVKRTFCRGQ